MNAYGEVYVKRHPELKMKIVDGSSLATALVLNTIPKGTTQVLLRGKLTKVAHAIVSSLCQKGVQVYILFYETYFIAQIKIVFYFKHVCFFVQLNYISGINTACG